LVKQPKLKSYEFPSQILAESRLSATLKEEHLQAIAAAINNSGGQSSGLSRASLAAEFRDRLHDDDLVTSGALIQCVKMGAPMRV